MFLFIFFKVSRGWMAKTHRTDTYMAICLFTMDICTIRIPALSPNSTWLRVSFTCCLLGLHVFLRSSILGVDIKCGNFGCVWYIIWILIATQAQLPFKLTCFRFNAYFVSIGIEKQIKKPINACTLAHTSISF